MARTLGGAQVSKVDGDRFLLSGEFHYFRCPRATWPDRLSSVREAGLDAVSIYVPWNWHQADSGPPDFGSDTVPERDLLGALDAIGEAGLRCILRPGPFITAEWHNGGIPDWLLTEQPDIRSRTASGEPLLGGSYPAITYAHPEYRSAAAAWLRAVSGAVSGHLTTRGGPIDSVQVDDETCYWQRLAPPLDLDYHPALVGRTAGGSVFARWLVDRHGGVDQAAKAHGCPWSSIEEIAPPTVQMTVPGQARRYTDWLDFKLHVIDEYVEFCVRVLRDAGIDVPISMLFPYLTSLQATKFTEFAERSGLEVDLTNECYVSLFEATSFPEQKVASVISCHETYRMWRRPWSGPPITMEMQASNSSFIPPSVMEVVYRLSIARGIRGFNYFMMVGGSNPPGFEGGTGSEYDIAAPIAADGHRRPHYDTIRRLSSVIRASDPVISRAEPKRDVWIGCSVEYDAQSMGGAALALDAWGIQTLLPQGDMGMSEGCGVQALMSSRSVSWGCLELERWSGPDGASAGVDMPAQLWVGSLDHMATAIQRRLAHYVTDGGHLVILPMLPSLDEHLRPCSELRDLVLSGTPSPEFAGFSGGFDGHSLVRAVDGGTMVVPGSCTPLTLPPGARPLAFTVDGEPCGFTRTVGRGAVSLLGFRLGYDPDGGPAGGDLLLDLVESDGRLRSSWTTDTQCCAFGLDGDLSGLLCVVNPVDVPVQTGVLYAPPGPREGSSHSSHTSGTPGTPAPGGERRRLPLRLDGIAFSGRGALLLPVERSIGSGVTLVHSTWELTGISVEPAGGNRGSSPTVTVDPGGRLTGELLFRGADRCLGVEGGTLRWAGQGGQDGELLIEIDADGGANLGPDSDITVRVRPAGADGGGGGPTVPASTERPTTSGRAGGRGEVSR